MRYGLILVSSPCPSSVFDDFWGLMGSIANQLHVGPVDVFPLDDNIPLLRFKLKMSRRYSPLPFRESSIFMKKFDILTFN